MLDVSWLFGGVSLRFGPLRANFGSTECLIILLVKSRPECFPVKLKSFGSVFSSFLSYILVLDVSWLFGGVSLRFWPLRANFGSSGASTTWHINVATAYVENGFLDSGVFLVRKTQVPTWAWCLVVIPAHQIGKRARNSRFCMFG